MLWQPYHNKLKDIARGNLVRLFYLNEKSGTSAQDHSPNKDSGTYSGVTLSANKQPNGMNAPSFDGVNDSIDVNVSDQLNTDWIFPCDKGTILVWWKVAGAGTWTDGTDRRIFQFRWDANQTVYLGKRSNNNSLVFRVETNNILYNAIYTYPGAGSTDWNCSVLRWENDLGATAYNEHILNNTSVAKITSSRATLNDVGTLQCQIGSNFIDANNYWSGNIGVFAFWQGVALSDEVIGRISKI